MTPLDRLRNLGACTEAIQWASQYPDLETAWTACERGDWMLWYAAKTGASRRQVVGIAAKCARLVQHLMTDERSIAALDACDRYARGEVSEVEMRDAYAAAYSAAEAVACDAARAAAEAVADAATLHDCADICRAIWPDLPEAGDE